MSEKDKWCSVFAVNTGEGKPFYVTDHTLFDSAEECAAAARSMLDFSHVVSIQVDDEGTRYTVRVSDVYSILTANAKTLTDAVEELTNERFHSSTRFAF